MVDAITGYIVDKISDYLVQEASLLLGVEDEVEGLKDELLCIQGFLKDAEQVEDDKGHAFREWINLVLDIAYEAEDILESYLLKVEDKGSERRFLNLIKKWSCIICEVDAYNIADDIRSLKKRINDLSRKFETYCNKNIDAQKATSSKLRQLKELRRAPSVVEEEHVVGVKEDADILLAKLLNGDSKTYMVSIFGAEGLGKTALARKLYNSSDVKGRFYYRGWICVSQEYKTRDLLKSIIKSFGVVPESALEMTEEDLERYLRQFLEGKRYLVVIDDVWEKEAWESLKRSFPRSVDGSRVIMTTRIKEVAEGADERVYAHNLRFLTFDESWELFTKKAFRDHESVNRGVEGLGRDMVQKCGGLPLAIIVLAGILSRKKENEWREVHNHIWRNLRNESIHISSLLDLSFNDLHHELKLCFRYTSIFPEDFDIEVEKLIQLLVAEGFLQGEDGELLEDVAEHYIHELMNKSLVQVGTRTRGRIITCRVHDLLRDLTIKKSKELNFINIHKGQKPSRICRREVVYHNPEIHFSARNMGVRLRSVLIFGERGHSVPSTDGPAISWRKLELLRVLDFGGLSGTTFAYISEGRSEQTIGKLIHLRYLGLKGKFLTRVSLKSISNLRYLQTLAASGYIFEEKMDLRKLTSLRHIYGRFEGDLLIGDATNLQTLMSVTSHSWSKMNQEKLINLRCLEIKDKSRDEYTRHIHLGMDSFSKLKNLRKLSINTFCLKFSPAECPPNLESLTLVLVKLEEDPIPIFEKLLRLEYLNLQVDNYPRESLICPTSGFPQLRTLRISIARLAGMHINEDAMPNLTEGKYIMRDGRFDHTKLMIPERLKAIFKIV